MNDTNNKIFWQGFYKDCAAKGQIESMWKIEEIYRNLFNQDIHKDIYEGNN